MTISDKLPEPVLVYIAEHPRVLYAVSVPLVAFAAFNLVKAVRLHEATRHIVGDMQRAASEQLGG